MSGKEAGEANTGLRASPRRLLAGALTYVAITAITLLGCEVAYRIYLPYKVGRDVADQMKPIGQDFNAFGAAPWKFDKDTGFDFNRTPWRAVIIADNRFAKCSVAPAANRFGNVGRDDPDYERADVKILLVGASFTLISDKGGRLVNDLVAQELSRRTGKRVSVLNFSRDATGLATHMDTVRARLDELRPDLVLVAANVTQLIYQRHWRVVTKGENGFRHLFFTVDPDGKVADPRRAALQPTVINDHITEEWCERNTQALLRRDYSALERDRLVPQLVSERERLYKKQQVPRPTVDFWRLDRSFVYSRLVHGNTFHGLDVFAGQPVYTHLELMRLSDDAGCAAAAALAKTRSVPILPVHIPTLPEMRASESGSVFGYVAHGVPPEQGASLVTDFAQLVGEPWVHLYKYYPAELKADPLKLVQSEADNHPSSLGVHAMADALVAMLLEHPAAAPLLKPEIAAHDLRK